MGIEYGAKNLYKAYGVPALDITFADKKSLVDRISGNNLVTFTRSSTATYVGSNGLIQTAASGAARFNHNPATGESLGLLVEEARTNGILYSGSISSSTRTARESIITENIILAPNGSLEGAKLAESTSSTRFREMDYTASATISPFGTGDITVSIFVKKGERDVIFMGNYNSTPSHWIGFNLTTETFFTVSGYTPAVSYNFQRFPGGWYRIWYTVNLTVNSSTRIDVTTGIDEQFTSYTGDGSSGIYVWGQCVEKGSFPTSYIPTSGSTVTRAADVATVSNTGSSIFPTSAFTTVNSPFGTAGGGTTVKLVGPTIKRTAVYSGDLTQTQINALAGVNDDFWRWRVLGSSFALPSFTTNGSVTVDWGDGVVETLTTAAHTFTNGGGYHDIGFRLNSGTFFKPNINDNATYKTRVIALGPAPASMKVDPSAAFHTCTALKGFDATLDVSGGTSFFAAWNACSSLTSFPLINTGAGTNFGNAWYACSSLTSFPLINTAAGTNFQQAWHNCYNLTSFPLINTASGTNFRQAWQSCSSLTSFPLIDTAAGTNFLSAWFGCSSLTSFPAINTGAGTNFQQAWHSCTSLTSFPLIDTAAGTNFLEAWRNCTSLTSFPLINTASGTNFSSAWDGCSSLTSFPLINTAAGTNFLATWRNCSNLTSFPLINTAAGTNFVYAWRNCSSLTSFPLLNTAAGTSFTDAWNGCTSLTDFPASFFDSWTGTPANNCFASAWQSCSALTATSVENILNSIDTSGQSAPASGVNITIVYNAGTGTPSVATAITNLQSRGWTITLNGVLQ